MTFWFSPAAVIAAIALASAAQAQTTPDAYSQAEAAAQALRSAASLAQRRIAFVVPPTQASALEQAVLPNRSIDRRFASDDVTGSVGFLCGREQGQTQTGSAAAFGSDPHGRFLGAKLSYSF